jgi:hypothetical protein
MLVRRGVHTDLEARARAESVDDVVTSDYYSQLSQIRLTGSPTDRPMQPETPTEVTLDGNDVAKLVECAIRHPTPNIRYVVLAAIWNYPDSFRQIFQLGLKAPPVFLIYARSWLEELDKCSPKPESPASNRVKPAVETLLPRMPLPAHRQDRERK